METKSKCTNCRKELDVGVDVTKIDEGVIGMRGFVPLGKPKYFCSDECVSSYFDMSGLYSIPGRKP